MLITGGLVVLGILALAVAFFLMREPNNSQPILVASPADTSATIGSVPSIKRTVKLTHDLAEELTSEIEDSDGQFREMASLLHTLHEQAQELEQRLGYLNEMIEQMERHKMISSGLRTIPPDQQYR
jgi:hypothetical protein